MKRFVYSLITLLQVGFLCNAAQVGFNRVGYVANVPDGSFAYNSVVLQADGKIVAVGTTDEDGNGNTNGLIARFNADGTLDTDFNEGGINGAPGYINQAGNTNASAYFSVVIDDNDKIVVVGQTNDDNGLIARFNDDGNLDMILDAENKSNLKIFREYAKNNNISIVLLG